VIYETVANCTILIAVAAEMLFSATIFFLKLIAPPPSADRAGEEKECLSSDSLQAGASLQAENAVRQSSRIENKNLLAGLPKHVHVPAVKRPIHIEEEESCLASGSLREKNAVEKTHISPGFLPLHRPAVAGPAAREPKCTRESTRIQKQTVRFSP
jgi:hypothetical protein